MLSKIALAPQLVSGPSMDLVDTPSVEGEYLSLAGVALDRGGVPILKDVSLSLSSGEIYGLLGPNGAGKTTTISAALGVLEIKRGSVRLFGCNPQEPGSERLRARVGVMPEQNGLYDWMTAASYLAFFADLYGVAPPRARHFTALEQVGLEGHCDQVIATFSRGMKQRLALARALVHQPDLLVLDEPTNGLDPRGRRDLHDVFLKLARSGTAILLSTHLLDDVERLCSRIGIIKDGRTVAEGAIADLSARFNTLRRYRIHVDGRLPSQGQNLNLPLTVVASEVNGVLAELAANTTPADAWRDAIEAGWRITEIEKIGGGLESLYLELTEDQSNQNVRVP